MSTELICLTASEAGFFFTGFVSGIFVFISLVILIGKARGSDQHGKD